MRKVLLSGAVAVVLADTGAALARSAEGPSSPPSAGAESAPGLHRQQDRHSKQGTPDKPDKRGKQDSQDKPGHAQDRPGKAFRDGFQHGENVVKDADGAFRTILVQRGAVESVSSTSITVRSDDGYSQAYAVDADTKIRPHRGASGNPPPAADSGKPAPRSAGSTADIAVGDIVRIFGVRDGDRVAAKRIGPDAGNFPLPGVIPGPRAWP